MLGAVIQLTVAVAKHVPASWLLAGPPPSPRARSAAVHGSNSGRGHADDAGMVPSSPPAAAEARSDPREARPAAAADDGGSPAASPVLAASIELQLMPSSSSAAHAPDGGDDGSAGFGADGNAV